MTGVSLPPTITTLCQCLSFPTDHAKKIVLFYLRNEKILQMIEELPDMGELS